MPADCKGGGPACLVHVVNTFRHNTVLGYWYDPLTSLMHEVYAVADVQPNDGSDCDACVQHCGLTLHPLDTAVVRYHQHLRHSAEGQWRLLSCQRPST